MLHVKTPSSAVPRGFMGGAREADTVDWRGLFRAMRQRLGMILTLSVVAMTAAGAYAVLRPEQYTAHTDLQLTNLKLTFSRDDALFAESLIDPTFLDTQIQLIKSDKILIAVVERLRLDTVDGARAPEFVQQIRAQLTRLGLPTPTPPPLTEDERRWQAVRTLQRAYTVERVATSNIVVIRVTARERQEAARLANEIARAYIDDQITARAEIAQSASIWLRERLRDVGPKTRVVAAATVPVEKSNPSGLLIVALAGLVGVLGGVTLSLAQHCFDTTVRTPEQAAAASGAECLGVMPLGRPSRFRSWGARPRPESEEVPGCISALEVSLHDPTSCLARALGHMKAAIDGALVPDAPRWIGITSVSSGEGASTVALALARFLTRSGARTLLIDCDGFRHTLSKTLVPEATVGLREMLAGDVADLQMVVRKGALCRLHLLPHGRAAETDEAQAIWSDRMRQFLVSAAPSYDYVLCDLPPLSAAAEVRTAARYLNGFLLVTQSGTIGVDHLRACVTTIDPFREMLFGVVLNKVRCRDLNRSGSPVATVFAGAAGPTRLLSNDTRSGRSPLLDEERLGVGLRAKAEVWERQMTMSRLGSALRIFVPRRGGWQVTRRSLQRYITNNIE